MLLEPRVLNKKKKLQIVRETDPRELFYFEWKLRKGGEIPKIILTDHAVCIYIYIYIDSPNLSSSS